jgi:1-acyl-sn-glycerol-3-phosphate acyltransferase
MAQNTSAANAMEPNAPPRRDGPSLQRLARALLRKPVRMLWPVDVAGAQHVPTSGAAILCPNHLSFFDSVFMMLTFDRPVYFIGKSEYLDSWTTRRLFPAMGMIPIDRDCGARAMIALDTATAVLRDGALLCIYPEGTRSRDGRLHRGYTGAARLAAAVGCPLVPVGIRGTAELQPPGARLPRMRRRCAIDVGTPWTVATGGEARRNAARATTDDLMQRIADLSGQEYVAQYTPRQHDTVVTDTHARSRVPAVAAAMRFAHSR